jgi:hypothetical protein
MAKQKTDKSKSSKSKALQEPARTHNKEKQNRPYATTFELWQAAEIAQGALAVAGSIETVGAKKSTLDKIDALRKAIVYTTANQIYPKLKDEQPESKLTEFHDLLLTITEEILPYYKCVNKKPVPAETVEKLKKIAERIKEITVGYSDSEGVPVLKITGEMRHLADDIPHYNYPDISLTGRAAGISFLLGALVNDLYVSKKPLSEDEEQTKSYLSQAANLLSDFSLKRFWPQNDDDKLRFKKQTEDDLRHWADRLDKCPLFRQYRDFSNMLSGEKNEGTKQINSIPENHVEQKLDTLNNSSRDKTKMGLREFFEKRTDVEVGVIDSKIKRIKAVDKKIGLLPKTANNPKGNETKLYYLIDLENIWPDLKDKIPTLPNIKK